MGEEITISETWLYIFANLYFVIRHARC